MYILMIGLNYKTASVGTRERFVFQEETKEQAIRVLKNTKSISEGVILGTCNRTEIYAVVDQLNTGRHYLKSFLADWFGVDKLEFSDFLYIKENDEAVEHLFRVTCGLDSMVLGETQILGQVKNSFFQSQNLKSTGTIFNMLFKQAITLAKHVQTSTDIGKNAVSVSYAAIELGKNIFGDFRNKTVVIVGAGKMGELTAKHLHEQGVNTFVVVNRTYERAKSVADQFNGKAISIQNLTGALIEADIVISSIITDSYVLTKQQIQAVSQKRNYRPLFMIDIAVPRNLDSDINDLDNVFLYDIDDLEGIVEANLEKRSQEAEKINLMIEKELISFKSWISTLGVVPIMAALREKSLTIHQEAVRHIENKLPDLTQRELKIIRKYSKSIVNQMLHDPLIGIKEMAASPNKKEVLDIFIQLFNLEEEIYKQNQMREHNTESDLPNALHPSTTIRNIPVHS
ncbi:glutamyl-tRNA reductase [Peribacillus butanolivorans]|uniref:glutamyl-tRNA reductase n=1 Tax=Peribacillus butanolivorans TaxID=421767 RepID=UPI00364F7E5F